MLIKMRSYARPETLEELLGLLAQRTEPAFLVAGGTDFIPRMKRPNSQPADVIDISRLHEPLSQISLDDQGLHIGAMATHTAIESSPLVQEQAQALAVSVRTIGARQIRNRATLAGNIANASPAGDSMPALLALDASVRLTSQAGSRCLPLSQFVTGPSRSDLKPTEMISEIFIPSEALGRKGWFKKLSSRNALVIALVSIAMTLDAAGRMTMAFGSIAPTPIRFPELENYYNETGDWRGLMEKVSAAVRPISDIRASAEYRTDTAANMVMMGLYELGAISLEGGCRE